MTTSLVERPGRWALPPQPPETWVGSVATLSLLIAVVAGVTVPSLVLIPLGEPDTALLALLYALGACLSAASAYLLVVQASVTQDRRLAWAAGGFAILWVVYLLRSVNTAVPEANAPETNLRFAAALSLCWLLALPLTAVTATLRRYGVALLAVPVLLVVGLGLAAYTLPLVHVADVRITGLGRGLALGAAAVGAGAALWWRRRVPRGNRGVWGWVGAALMLTPVVGLLRAISLGRHDPTAWASLVVEDIALFVPLMGLYAESARGYLRQARRWRQLETEIRQVRVSSALLPGLSTTPEDEAGLPERSDVVELIARADMQVALQPVIDLTTGTVVGQEALARFGGRVPTDRWFRASVLHGLGIELEHLTLARALATLDTLPHGHFLAINTSPAALQDSGILTMLAASDLSRLVVEITEHDAVNDYDDTRETFRRLRAGGARIAVDDVGAGFASLRHVLLLQPDIVKLDTSLTRDVHQSSRQHAIVRALVTFADEVGATVLAEGIEVAEQVPALLEAGVTLGQGWHLGVPVTLP